MKKTKIKEEQAIGKEKRPMFDIVAGTSIGGMNGAIVVSSILQEVKVGKIQLEES